MGNKLEWQLQEKLNNFTPSEMESYLEVLLKKCLEAVIQEDYLTLGNTEEILNKSIMIINNKVSNFNIMYSNLKLKVAVEYLNRYVKVNNTEAFKFLNILPEFVTVPEKITDLNKKELLIKLEGLLELIERDYNYLRLTLNYLYILSFGKIGTEEGSKITAAFSHMIEILYNKNESNFNELQRIADQYKEGLINASYLALSEKETELIKGRLFYINSGFNMYEKFKELIENPFNEVAELVFTDNLDKIFNLEEPVTDLEAFKDSLETEEEIVVYNTILKDYISVIPIYDFNNFIMILPAEANIPEDIITAEFEENLPEDSSENLTAENDIE